MPVRRSRWPAAMVAVPLFGFSVPSLTRSVAITGGLIVFVALGSALGQSPSPSPRSPALIRGRVFGTADGMSIPNVRITVEPPIEGAPSVVMSDAEGRFSVLAAIGRSRVVAAKSGFGRIEVAP